MYVYIEVLPRPTFWTLAMSCGMCQSWCFIGDKPKKVSLSREWKNGYHFTTAEKENYPYN